MGRAIFTATLLYLACILPSLAKPPTDTKIYIAAALFNGRETRFNIDLVKHLENKNYKTIFPQRDGFEYKLLAKTAEKYFPKDKIATNVRDLIYLLDMGIFIPESDLVVANLDEPLDDGMIVEITYAHLMGKPVIGFRTDIRTPYGNDQKLGGMHAFVAFQCDYLIIQHLSAANETEANLSIQVLTDKIDRTIQTISLTKITKSANANVQEKVDRLTNLARKIITDPKNIHTDEGLKSTVKRLIKNKEVIQPLLVV